MASKDQIDQDALAAEWGVALDAEQQATAESAPAAAEQPEGDADAMAAHWATMVDDGQFIQAAKGGAERILTQEEIDSRLGFSLADVNLNDNSGIRAIIDSAMVSYERLPMLEIVFDRLVRLMTTSLRNFTSDTAGHHDDELEREASLRRGGVIRLAAFGFVLVGLGRRFVLRCRHRSSLREGARSRQDKRRTNAAGATLRQWMWRRRKPR